MSNELFAAFPADAPSTDAPSTDAASTGAAYAAIAEIEARFYLDQVMALVGVDGLVEALSWPALLAAIDQHAATVRDALTRTHKEIGPVSLARYARSVLAVHRRHGRKLPSPETIDWTNAGWTVLRLVAVCSLADAANCF